MSGLNSKEITIEESVIKVVEYLSHLNRDGSVIKYNIVKYKDDETGLGQIVTLDQMLKEIKYYFLFMNGGLPHISYISPTSSYRVNDIWFQIDSSGPINMLMYPFEIKSIRDEMDFDNKLVFKTVQMYGF